MMIRSNQRNLWRILAIVLLVATTPVLATGETDEGPPGVELAGRIVDSISFERRPIDWGGLRRFPLLISIAEALHAQTRVSILRRELLFATGDPYDPLLAEEVARNLRSDYSLTDAFVEVDTLPSGGVHVRVVTLDEWSLRGGVRFSRDGDENRLNIGIEERNLFGRNLFTSFDFFNDDRDGSFVAASFRDRRLNGWPIRLSAGYSGDPRALLRQVAIQRPYYNLQQRWTWSVIFSRSGGLNENNRDQSLLASWEETRDLQQGILGFRIGPYDRKLEFELSVDRVENRISDQRLFSLEFDPAAFPIDSGFVKALGRVSLVSYDFVTTRQINGWRYREDYQAGLGLFAGFGRATDLDLDAYVFDQVEFGGTVGFRFGGHLLLGSVEKRIFYRRDIELRRTATYSMRVFQNSLPFVTLALRGRYQRDWREDGTDNLALGGPTGVRGYARFYQTGNRLGTVNVEARFWPGFEILSVVPGAVVFVDAGQAWRDSEALTTNGFVASRGIGLRFSLERISRGELVRIDLARINGGELTVTVGTQQYF